MALLKNIIPDPKTKRQTTIGEALRLVNQIFRENEWGEREQKSYFKTLGIAGTNSPEDVRRIIEDMERSGMILFEQ